MEVGRPYAIRTQSDFQNEAALIALKIGLRASLTDGTLAAVAGNLAVPHNMTRTLK